MMEDRVRNEDEVTRIVRLDFSSNSTSIYAGRAKQAAAPKGDRVELRGADAGSDGGRQCIHVSEEIA